jgi:hypothetical protein
MERRAKVPGLWVVLVTILVMLLASISSGQALANPGGGCLPCQACDPCGPAHASLFYEAFDASIDAKINGTTLSAGETIILQAGVSVSISLLGASSPNFLEWSSNIGSFGNGSHHSTTYTPPSAGGSGTIEAVMNGTNCGVTGHLAA